MKIIETESRIKDIKKGDEYIIKPSGFDYNKPEEIDMFLKEIEKLQKLIDNKFKTE